jgi:ribosome maturation factor RimP
MTWQASIETTVTGLGYDLVDTERSPRGLLRVFIDHPPAVAAGAFITVEDCEKVTRQLQHVLEVEACAYERLEVSSPGLDRPLKKAADYARFVGEQIEVTLKLPFQGRKKYRGVLHALGEGWRIVLVEPEVAVKGVRKAEPRAEQALDFSLEEVREARLVPVVDFKGRRFAPPPALTEGVKPQGQTDASVELDGDRKQ